MIRWHIANRLCLTAIIALALARSSVSRQARPRAAYRDQASADSAAHPDTIAAADIVYTAPVPPGAAAHCTVFVESHGARVLVVTDDDTNKFYWLRRRRLLPASIGGDWPDAGDMGPAAVDFYRCWVYRRPGKGSPPCINSGLYRVSLGGERSELLERPDDALYADYVVPRARGDRLDVIVHPCDSVQVSPPTWLRTYRGGKLVRELFIRAVPDAVLYAAKADRLFFVYGSHVVEWHGSTHVSLPNPPHAADNQPRFWPVAITADARYIYRVDPPARIISKILVATGRVVAQRRVGFDATCLVVQGARDRLLMAGEKVGDRSNETGAIYVLKCF